MWWDSTLALHNILMGKWHSLDFWVDYFVIRENYLSNFKLIDNINKNTIQVSWYSFTFCSLNTGFIPLYSAVYFVPMTSTKRNPNPKEISMLNQIIVNELFLLSSLNSMPVIPSDIEQRAFPLRTSFPTNWLKLYKPGNPFRTNQGKLIWIKIR